MFGKLTNVDWSEKMSTGGNEFLAVNNSNLKLCLKWHIIISKPLYLLAFWDVHTHFVVAVNFFFLFSVKGNLKLDIVEKENLVGVRLIY